MSQRLGDLLVKEKIITPEQLQQATKVQKETTAAWAVALGEAQLPYRMRMSLISFRASMAFPPSTSPISKLTLSVVKLIPYETANVIRFCL